MFSEKFKKRLDETDKLQLEAEASFILKILASVEESNIDYENMKEYLKSHKNDRTI